MMMIVSAEMSTNEYEHWRAFSLRSYL